MPKLYTEVQLASLAKRVRKKTGKTKAGVARELKITKPTMQDVEERPEKNLTKLRRRIIEKYSRLRVSGPWYLVKSK